MRRALSATIVLCVAAGGVGAACQNPTQAPTPTPPSVIYDRMTDAGCYKASDAGLYWITQEVTQPNPPAWARCMREGGAVAGCGVPCTPPTP